jgi:hypothetical protein
MYKLSIQTLKDLKKQLEASNKALAIQAKTPAITKLIKNNEKQIKLLMDNYYI